MPYTYTGAFAVRDGFMYRVTVSVERLGRVGFSTPMVLVHQFGTLLPCLLPLISLLPLSFSSMSVISLLYPHGVGTSIWYSPPLSTSQCSHISLAFFLLLYVCHLASLPPWLWCNLEVRHATMRHSRKLFSASFFLLRNRQCFVCACKLMEH